MSKVRVVVAGTIGKSVLIDTNPSAQIGTNFYMPDGTLADATKLRTYLGIGSGGSMRHQDLQGLRQGDDHPQYPLWNGRETINGQWDFTKAIWSADGTAAAPAFTFTLDTNLGIYRIGADNMGISTAGALRWDINSSRTYQTIPVHVEMTVPNATKQPLVLLMGNSVDLLDNGVIEFSRHVTSSTDRGFQFGLWDDVAGGLANLPPAGAGVGFRWRTSNPSTINQPDLIFYAHNASAAGTEIYRHSYNNAQMLFVAGSQGAPTVAIGGLTNGMYYDSANARLSFSIAGTGNLAIHTGHIRVVPQIWANDGSASAPLFSFLNDPDTGGYRVTTNTYGVSAGGTLRWSVSDTAITSALVNLGSAGSASAPSWSFSGDPNTGAYNSAADTWAIATNGTLRWSISTTAATSTLPMLGPSGSASAPTWSFSGDTNTGAYSGGTDIYSIATGGSERFRIGAAGEIGLSGANYGTAGQVLTSAGSGVAPTWEDPTGGGGGSLVYANTSVPAGNTIANTAAETAFNSAYDIPANQLQAGSVVRIKLYGVFSTTGTPTLRIRIKLDANTYIDTTAVVTPAGASNLGFSAEAVLVCFTAGAAGTVDAQGVARYGLTGTTSQVIPTSNTATITTDTTQILSLTATAQWGAADPANTITLREMVVWIEDAVTPTAAAPAAATYLTEDDESSTLPNSRQLLAGTNVTFDDSVAGERTIDVSGGTALGARVQLTSTQSISSGSNTAVSWPNPAALDENSYWSSGNPTRLTAPSTGWYNIQGMIEWPANSSSRRLTIIRLNGTTTIGAHSHNPCTDVGVGTLQNVSVIRKLTAGDYVELVGRQDSGSSLSITTNSIMLIVSL